MKYSIESYIDHLFSIAWQISTNSNRLAFLNLGCICTVPIAWYNFIFRITC